MAAVYTIAKNESEHIERWAASEADADVRVVVDTGSSDNTVALVDDGLGEAEIAGARAIRRAVADW